MANHAPGMAPAVKREFCNREYIMGLLVDGKWQDKWYDTKSTGGRFKRSEANSVTGSLQTAVLAPVVTAAFRQRVAAIICMCPTPAPGPTAP